MKLKSAIILNVIFIFGCQSTSYKSNKNQCYEVQYTHKKLLSKHVNNQISLVIEQLNDCKLQESKNTLLSVFRGSTWIEQATLSVYLAGIMGRIQLDENLEDANYEGVIERAKLWLSLIGKEFDKDIDKQLYIAHRQLGNEVKANEVKQRAFLDTKAAEQYLQDWKNKLYEKYASPARALHIDKSRPKAILRIEPKYPRETIAEQGWVKLSYRVNSSGYVQEIEVVDVSEKGGFGDEAKIALSQWLFLPAEDASGVPIMSEVMTIGFSVRIEP